jgi:hypothetical protein
MRDEGKWSVGIARFAGLVANFPQWPNEEHVFQYHHIIKILEEACGKDLSRFRIAPEHINPRQRNKVSPGNRGERGYVAKSFVELVYFRTQVRGLVDHVKTILDDRLQCNPNE